MRSADEIRRDGVVRDFFAAFLKVDVERDGQVKGFGELWDSWDQDRRALAMRHAVACDRKIERDGRDPEECIAAGVKALKEAMRLYRPRDGQETYKLSPDHVNEIVASLCRRHGWQDRPQVVVRQSAVTVHANETYFEKGGAGGKA